VTKKNKELTFESLFLISVIAPRINIRKPTMRGDMEWTLSFKKNASRFSI